MATDPAPAIAEPEYNVYCSNPDCRALVGHYVQVGREVWICIGSMEQRSARGRCVHCHTEYCWEASEKTMPVLVARLKKSTNRVIVRL